LCIAEEIGIIVPTLDTELQILADHKEMFLQEGVHVIVSSSDFVQKCRDKRKINAFFGEQGIDIPKPIDKNQPTFPLFIKPYDGSLSADTYLIKNPEELTPYHLQNEKLLFMEYVSNTDYDEFTVDMYYGRDNQVKCIVPRKRIEVRGGEISKGVTRKNSIVSFLREKLSFIDGAVGCLTLQLFLHKTNHHILAIEINPRFGGGFPLSYKAGANYPAFLIQEYLFHKGLSYFESWSEDLLMLRYDNEVIIHDYTA
jgi:carbamoyl-phosphate synthase large subunit